MRRSIAATIVFAAALIASPAAWSQNAVNSATVTPPATVTDPNNANNSATDTDPVTRTSNLSLTKTASPSPVAVGQLLTYTLTVSNAGPSAILAASTFSIVESLPAGLTGCSFTPSAGTFTVGTIASGATGTGTWTGVAIPSGGNATLTIACTVGAAAAASITNTATVVPPTGTTDPDCSGSPVTCAGGNTGSVTTPVNRPQLTMSKTVSASPLVVGVPASYTLQLSNTGTSATTAVTTITDTIPTGLTIGTLPVGCSAAGQVVTCTVAAGLAAGGNTSFIIPITPTLAAGASVTNSATASGGGDPTCPAAVRCTGTVGPTPVNAPQLTMTKTASAGSFTVGMAASYTLQVSNTGTAATTAVTTITDTIPTGLTIGTLPVGCSAAGQVVTCTIAAGLAAGGNTSFVIPVTPTASAAASVTNTATVSGGGDSTCPAAVRCSSSVTTPVDRPQLTMSKTVSASPLVVGVPASYTLQLSNTGTSATTAVTTITDTIPTGLTIGTLPVGCSAAGQVVTCTVAAGLAAGGNTSFIIPITPTLAAGASVTNSATASGGGDPTCPAAARCTGTVGPTPVNAPQLTMTKTASAASFTVGVPASYTLQVSNTGTAATTAVTTITDTIPTGLTIGTLPAGCSAAGQVVTCTVAAGLAAGGNTSFIIPITPTLAAGASVTNSATASGGGDPTCPAAARCTGTVGPTPVNAPQLTMTKTASAASFTVGVPASYTLQVSNTGTAATTAVTTITDTIPTGLTIGTLPAGCSAAGQTVTCTVAAGLAAGGNTSFVIPVTPTAIAAASVTNTATVSGGGDSSCPAAGRCSSSVTTPVNRPNINLAKTAGTATGPNVSGVYSVTYTVTVTNSGAAAGTYGALTDSPVFPAAITETGIVWTTSGAGAPPSGSQSGAGAYQLAPAGNTIGTGVTHTFNVTISYRFDSNTPPTVCAGVPTPGSGLYNAVSLPVGQENGATTDNATCVNSPPQPPFLTLTKSASASPWTVGVPASYTLQVTNTGGVATTAVSTITDTIPAGLTIGTLPAGCSAAGQTVTCTVPIGLAVSGSASFVIPVTPTLAATPSVTNSATVSGGGDPGCPAAARCTGTVGPTPVNAPQLTMTKTASAASFTVGVPASYTLTLSNTGTAATTAVAMITDVVQNGVGIGTLPAGCTNAGQTVTCTVPAGLVAGGSVSFIIPITPTLAAGASVTNTATVSGGGDPTCPADVRCSSTVTTPVNTPQLTLTKTASAASFTIGVPASYTLQVSNTGTAATTAVSTITDTIPAGLTIGTLPAGCSAAGQVVTCTVAAGLAVSGNASFIIPITPTEAALPTATNTATVSGGGDPTCPAAARCTSTVGPTPITFTPALTIDKTAGTPSGNTAGSTIAYTFLVTNTGNVTITGIAIVDPNLDAPATCPVTTLAPGASTTCTGTHTITQAEVNAGTVNNSATATGTPPGGGTTTSPPDTTTTPIVQTPALTIDKTAGTPSGNTAGSTIAYTFLVTNTGNVTITGLVVNDAQLDAPATCPVTTLAPGASTTCTGTHTITQAEVNAGTVNNSATATGTPPGGGTTTSPPDTTTTPIVQTPSLTIDKTAGTPSGNTAGSTIAYTFLVTNTGNVTITGIAIVDPNLDAPATCPVTTLAPGASTTCTGTHTITQAEVNAGTVNNSATATGTPPGGGTTTSPPDTTTTPIVQTPALTIDKTAGTPSGNTAGSTIAYTFLVTNTGNVTITGIAINDPNLDAPATCPVTTLAPGASTTCTGTHTITQAEVNAGTVNNSATATGTPPGGGTTTSPPDTTATPIVQTPALTIDKTAGTPSGNTAGSTIAYTFLVTNTGNVTITGIAIVDPNLDAPATCPVTTLAPGASTTCTGTHTITQAEVNAGTVNNSATATGTPPGGGTTTSPPDTTTTPIVQTPSLTIDKTAGTPSGNTAGSTIAYTFLVTNTGNVTITGIAIVDPNLDAPATCPVTTLAPGASTTCTGTHTITQAEVNAGTVNNAATATGTPPGGGTTTSPPDTTTTPIVQTPSLTIDKTAGTPSGNTAGSTIAYTFLVTNTGNVTITGIAIVDPNLDAPATCPVTTLAPGASTTCTGTHTITQAEVNAGTVNNSATATGTPPGGGTTTSPPDTTTTPIVQTPALTIDKTAGTPSGNTAGSTIAYTFLVTNTGNVTITGLVINDAQLDAAATCPVTTLAPGASTTCTGTHTITQAEVNAGVVNNSATATGTTPGGGTTTSPPDTTSTPLVQTPALTIDKTAGTPSGNSAGSTIAYTFLVTNTGNVTLTGIVVNDAQLDAPAVCAVTTLAPGASTTCTGTHTITQAEVNAGVVNNSATATGTPPGGGTTTSPPDTTTTPIVQTPSLTIDKTAGTPSGNTAGSTIAYTFLVTNTGNVTITGIAIVDPNLDAPATCPVTTLAPGASTTCTGTHTITQAEVNAGTVNNSATAVGTPPGGGTTTSPPDTTTTPIVQTPALTIDKTAGTPSGNTAGSTIAYTFLVTNTGNVTITGIAIVDPNLDAPATCPVTTLAPGASTTCTGTHTITQAEVNAGTVNNSATAVGTPPGGGTTTSPPDTTTTPIVQTPALTIDKTAGTPSGNTAGSTIAYTFLVTNTGNVTITGIAIVDPNLDAPATCPVTTLAPGASTTCTGTHTITQAEVNAGTVNNAATATGTPPGGGTTTSPPDTTTTPIVQTPSLTIDKTAGTPSGNTAGSTIAYTFLVTNTGNVTITGIAIVDPNLDAPATCPVTTLAPGASTTCTGTHTITQAEVNAGTVNNSATAVGTPPGGGTTTSPPDTTTTPIVQTPALTIDKTAGTPSGNTAGSTIAYTFLVTNTGNVTITGIAIVDPNLDAPATCPVTTLAPGASTTCTGTHTITQAEVNAGTVNNSATATGTPPGGGTTTSPPDTTTTPIVQTPSLTIDKTAGTPSGNTAGSTIAYTFLVTNTGNVTITGIAIVDPNLDAPATCPVTTLAPGASTTCTGMHTITQAEVNAGTVNNSATATGTPPGGGTTTSPPDTTTTPIVQTPALTIDKTAGTPSGNTAGSTIAYTFLVTNTGNVTITGIAIVDPNLDAPATCPVTTLAPGASTTCTGTHTITQAEVNAGTVNNAATATGTPPGGGTTTSPPDTTTTPIVQTPSLTIDKTAGTPSGNTAGSTIAYTFLVTNTGNVTITGIAIVDPNLDAPATCPVTTLAPGASTTCTGTHTITQAEVNAGTVNNSATATGTPPGGGTTTSPPDTTTTPIVQTPALTIDKTAGTPSGNTAGSTIAYTFLVTNTGNVTITGIAINDPNLDAPATCPVTTLAPGASTTCTGTHTITQAEVNAGVVNNAATATGTPPGGGTTTSPPDTTTTPIVQTPALTIDKTAGAPSGNTAGSTIAYTFLVTNTGNVTITGIAIVDPNLDAPATCPVTTLAPGASTTCTGTHTITQAEVNAGTVNNSATATGTPPGGGATTSPPDTTTTPLVQTPALTIDKTAGTPSGNTAGSTIAYTFLVTNTGNVTITGLVINDAQLDAAATCPVTTLAPGASTTCTGTHTITQAEVNAGTVNNSATAVGTPPGGGTTTSPPDTTTTPIVQTPALTIDKTAGTPSGNTAGSTIAYTFLVTNTGNVTITGIAINDPNLDAPATCPVTTLAPGASTTCTGTHTITQAEVNAGVVNNSATATGTPPGGGTTTSPPDTTTTPIVQTPALTIDKTAGTPSGNTAGSTIAYTFLVTNTGNVTLTGIVINDAQLDAPATCPVTTLAPGASTTCTGTHTITQAEVNAGVVNNSATATGTPPGGGTTTSPPDTTTTPIVQTPSLTIDKTAGTPSGNTAGSTIAYTFLVTNTGNVTITGIAIVDPNLDAPATCPVTTLAPGASTTCTGTHTITQAEVNAGVVNNSATATGTPPGGGTTTSPPDTTTTPLVQTPALTIDKTAGTPSGNTAGSTIAYTFLVTNTGNVTLTGIVINDAQLDAPATCPVTTLAPGASTTCTGTHTITQAEVNAGTVNNSATATGTPPGGGTTTSPPDTTTTPIVQTPALTIDKTAGTPSGNTAGSTIAYTFLVTNTGNVTITGIAIVDPNLDAPATCPVTTLAPGASTTCTGTHTITQAEVNAGTVNNSATAVGTPPGGGTTTSPPDTTTTPIVQTPALTIDKTAGTPSGNTAGSTIAYTFLVTNTGNVTITGIAIVDPNLDAPATCPVTTLAPGASTTCTGTHTITQAEVNAGTVNNSATATGTPPGGGTTTSPPDTTTTPIVQTPSLTIDKTAGTPSGNTAGSTIAYTFLVTNTGNVTITGIAIVDPNLDAPATCPVTTLAPGASTTCTGTHTITQAEVNAGVVNNSATATGTPPGGGTTTSPPDTTTTPLVQTPALTIDKTAGTPSGNTAGSTIAYTFLVTNTGNVTITGLVINDAQLDAAATCPVTTLAPGASTTCTGTHTITQAEVNAGVVNNSATATGTTPGGGTTTSPPDTTSTPLVQTPALTIDKTAGTPSGNTAGSTIAYTFLVTNTGNVTLTDIVVNDAQLDAPAVCAVTTLAPGASTTCTGTHTITQAEVNAGVVNNSATATGTAPGGGTTTSPPDTTSTPIAPAPALTIDKVAGASTGNTAGSTIAYTFLVTNTGNVTITGIAINDANLDAPATCPVTTLAPGASTTCTGAHTITQAEVNAGVVNNTATAVGTPPGGGTTTSPPDTTSTPLVAAPALTIDKTAGTPSGNTAGSTIIYSFLVTNTGNVPLTGIVVNDAQLDAPAVCPVTTLAPTASTTCTGTHTITQAEVDAGRVNNSATATGTPPVGPPTTSPPDTTSTPIAQSPLIVATKTATLTTDGGIVGLADAGDVITYAVSVRNNGNVTLTNLVVVDSFEGGAPTTLTCTPTTLAPGATATCNAYTHTVTAAEAAAGGTLDNVVTATATSATSTQTVSSTSTAVVAVNAAPAAIRIVKTASPRDVNVGDLVRYTLTMDNTGLTPMSDGTLIDTPPAGFTYVDGSLAVADADNAGRLVGTYPIRVDQIDIAAGGRATITYLLRVGAGVRPGVHTNSAYVEDNGSVVSNVATANVQMVSDPMLDDSLIVGTVWNDRDGDQWQDAAGLSGVRVQGGFAPDSYVPNSTTVDRGTGAASVPDASSPMLHGIDVGTIAARQSEADPVAKHTVVIRQKLRELRFTDDFVLTSAQGVTVRMAADGSTRVEKSGDAAKGLNAAEPTVERRISQVADGYQVDYVIANAGIDERGIPGVRVASVEGLLIETDQYGRYRLVGVDGGRERGRNIILKVDPATLPPGSTFTTDNPLVRRVTPGLPTRFDFGVKMPVTVLEGGMQNVEMELGEVVFHAESSKLREEYLPVIEKIAEQVRKHGNGEVVLAANGETQALAYDRAKAVQTALLERLGKDEAQAVKISLRTDLADPGSTLVSLGESPVLGTVLFDTDQAAIKPEFEPVIAKVAEDIERLRGGVVGIIGHADKRGAADYNVALGMRRAKAVYEAIAAKLSPEVRSKLRVDFSDNPTAPVGIRGQ